MNDSVYNVQRIEFIESLERKRRRVRKRNFQIGDEVDFLRRYRLTKTTVSELLTLIEEDLRANSHLNNSLEPIQQLLIALRFYATGAHQHVLGDLVGVSQRTVSRTIKKVSQAIASLRPQFINLPQNEEECLKISEKFFSIAQFPSVIGSIDCTHIPILSPGGTNSERFRNRKGFFSLNVQTIVSADLIIQNVVARWPGSTHDSTILNNSTIPEIMQGSVLNKYHLLGDSGYPCQPFLLTPINQTTAPSEIRYNTAHVLTRNTVERSYGVLKQRFPCLQSKLRISIDDVPTIIVACCILHNLAVKLDWCKSSVSYVTVKNAKKNCKKRFDLYDYNNREDPTKVNMLVPKEEYALELPHPDSHLLNAEDEIFFYGTNSKSELLIVKICRELDNRAHACVYMKLANGKVYELVKTSDFQQSCTDEMTFSCGGLQLQCTYPMRAWRLFFAGYLRELSEDDPIDSQMRYVKFALLWRASSDVHDFLQDINMNYFPSSLSGVPWHGYRPHISEANRAMDFYGQAGVIHGTITVESESEDNEIYLFGQRIRYLGSTVHLKDLEFRHILGYVKTNGMYFHLGTISSSNIFKNYISGFVVQPDAKTKDIQKATILMSSFERGEKLKSDFSTESFDYTFNASAIDLPSLNKITKCSRLKWLEFELNGEKGHGIIIERMQTIKEDNHYSEIHPIEVPPVVPPVVSFKENICQLSEISGGKGSSLGKLTQLCKDIQTFTVPNGIVVTTSAYESFLTNPILVDIKDLEGKFYNDTSKPEDIKESCKRVAEAFVQTEFPNSLKECIHKSLISNFGEKIYSVKFAVRSSATGEDTEQMSAAGQMETYLGVSGLDEILLAVKKCWASQFSFIATDYKRRYGQRLNSPMAVVIQEMISCNVAGVLFTCDPLTGNPTLMSITSNYGLGESVVSGSEEPDIIQLKRDVNDELSITTITVGAKCRKVVVEDRQGTCTSEVPENERKVCSLSEDMTFRLANLAIKIEKHYRSHRDIEWGVFNDNIYIFQSRPVTSGTNETVYEIEHEFDGPIRVENDFYSVSNVGEVFPGAMSPLGMTVVMKSFTMLLNGRDVPDIQNRVKPNYFLMGGLIMYNHVLFNIADMFHDGLNDKVSIMEKAMMISYFGRLLKDKELFEVAQARYKGLPKMNPLLKLRVLAKIICFNNKRINKIMDDYSNYKIPVENYSTAKDLCHHLVRRCWDIVDVGFSHMLSSSSSAVWSMIIFATLGKAQGDFDDIVYHDFAMLVKTDSDVESADVPSAIQKLAFHISKSLGSSEFKRMTTKDAVKFLTTSTDETGKQFRKFLDTHGHRCLQEFDIYSQSWRENPASLVKLLQNSCGNVLKDTAEKDHDNVNELISKINIPLGFIDKKKLKFIIPLSRKSVQNRERTKSMLMKVIDVWRQAYRKLAKLMFQEGLIPDDDLLFFMTLEEVTLFLENKSPKIIARATQRRRRFPVMHRYRFPEIMKGLPKPINEEENTTISNEDNFLMKGIPVSQGVAKGFLRKALYFEEAEEIKSGEILLTYSTDIAWTPYFPQLAGVVTELGGLISHGAVVSREYGIPCIAGLHGATKQFQTGDYVMLDGNKGILQKLKKPEN